MFEKDSDGKNQDRMLDTEKGQGKVPVGTKLYFFKGKVIEE